LIPLFWLDSFALNKFEQPKKDFCQFSTEPAEQKIIAIISFRRLQQFPQAAWHF